MTDGGPAFPQVIQVTPELLEDKVQVRTLGEGMSLRAWFAGQALHGLCADRDEAGSLVNKGAEWLATEAWRIADAMLKAREAP